MIIAKIAAFVVNYNQAVRYIRQAVLIVKTMKNNIVTGEILRALEVIGDEDYQCVLSCIKKAKRVFVAGSGRSGLVGRCFAMRLMHLGVESYVAGETTCPPIKKGDVLVIISCRGENNRLLDFAKTAQACKAKVLAVTTKNTPVSKISDYAVKMPVQKSKQFYNSLFEQTVFLFFEIFVEIYRKNRNLRMKAMAARHANLE